MAFENDPEGYRIAMAYAGGDFDKPRTLKHQVLIKYPYEEWSLDDFLALINEAASSIPPPYRSSAKVEMHEPGYDGTASLRMSYVGPESAADVAARIRRCEQYVAERRASERATYESLKRKFESQS